MLQSIFRYSWNSRRNVLVITLNMTFWLWQGQKWWGVPTGCVGAFFVEETLYEWIDVIRVCSGVTGYWSLEIFPAKLQVQVHLGWEGLQEPGMIYTILFPVRDEWMNFLQEEGRYIPWMIKWVKIGGDGRIERHITGNGLYRGVQ